MRIDRAIEILRNVVECDKHYMECDTECENCVYYDNYNEIIDARETLLNYIDDTICNPES